MFRSQSPEVIPMLEESQSRRLSPSILSVEIAEAAVQQREASEQICSKNKLPKKILVIRGNTDIKGPSKESSDLGELVCGNGRPRFNGERRSSTNAIKRNYTTINQINTSKCLIFS